MLLRCATTTPKAKPNTTAVISIVVDEATKGNESVMMAVTSMQPLYGRYL